MKSVPVAVTTVLLSALIMCTACQASPADRGGVESAIGTIVEAFSTTAAFIGELVPASREPSEVVPVTESIPLQKQAPEGLTAILELSMAAVQPLGTPLTVDVTMVNQAGRIIPNMVLIASLDGEQIRRERTDQDGKASIYLGRDLPVGTHEFQVNFIGTQAYRATVIKDTITIRPAHLMIKTVPPLPGIGFSLAEQTLITGEDGTIHFEVDKLGTHPLKILPLPKSKPEAPVLIEFARWDDTVFVPEREIDIVGDEEIMVGFELSYLVNQTFFDLAGKPVDPARISSITVKSSSGTRYVYEDIQPRWRKAARIVNLKNGLESSPIQYGLERVIIDGTNVVNQNQQRFLVTGQENWPVQLLLYSMRLRGIDAVFGFPIGSGIDVTYPSGRVESFTFDGGNGIFIDSLARGLYKVQVKGASGIAPLTPVALSRDQDVALKVLSTLDISIGLALGALFALGLLLYGRPQVVTLPYRLLRDWHGLRPAAQRPSSSRRMQPRTTTSQMFDLTEADDLTRARFMARSGNKRWQR